MAEANTKQPLSIRATDEIKEKFRTLTEELGVNSGEVFEKLIATYERSQNEASMPEFTKDFKDFETHLNALSIKFHNAYGMIANAEETAIQKFERELSEKTNTILNLQEQLKTVKEEKAVLADEKEQLKAQTAEHLNARTTAEQTAAQLLKDKEDLRKQIDNFNEQINSFKEHEKELNSLNSDLSLKLKESSVLADKVNSLENDLRDSKHQIDLKDLELVNVKKSFSDLTNSYNRIEGENSQLKESLDSLKDSISSLKENIASLKAEAAEMKVIKSQLEDEKKRSDELQKALLSSVVDKTTKRSSQKVEKA